VRDGVRAADTEHPERSQRNKVLEASTIIPRHEFEQSAIYAGVFAPLNLHAPSQPRVLLCDDDRLLGWFGAIHPDRTEAHQLRVLELLAPSMRGRLLLQQRWSDAGLPTDALHATIDLLATPAFVVDNHGQIRHANAPGRAMLDSDKTVRSSFASAVLHEGDRRFDKTPLRAHGATVGWLALAKPDLATRARSCIDRIVSAHRLTPRQCDVLRLAVDGHATATIADELAIGTRAVELHLTALFDRFGVDSRSALVARVLSS
jgi:DNA-binding NarL/FixJ family response regulator